MSENIEIKVQDQVDPSIAKNLRDIAALARDAFGGITRLQQALNQLKAPDGMVKLQDALSKTALRHQRLQTEIQRTATQMANSETALQRAIAAEARANIALQKLAENSNKAQIQTEKLAQAQARTNAEFFNAEKSLNRAIAAENNAATSAQRLATEQQRTANATAQTALTQQRLTTETQKLATAQYNTSTAASQLQGAQVRLATAQTNNATATQRLATAQQQTVTATTNAATAQQRLTTAATQGGIAQQNLANAQARGAVQAQNLATAQQKTVAATNNAAAAATRAQSAALRLQQQQQKLQAATNGNEAAFSSFTQRLFRLAAAAATVNTVVKLADAYTNLQNKLQNVTETAPQVQRLTDELFNLADRTRTGVDSTATAFVRFDRALKLMGKSQEDTLRMTETVNKALIVSGATTTESASSLLQLSQAFNSGKLAGDEFRSVSENMPVVLDAVAKALDKPVNQVKKMASEGKVTSEVLFKAFKLIEKQIDDTFAKTSPTVAQAFTVMRNNVERFIGEVDKTLGITENLSKFILMLARNLDTLAVAAAVAGAAMLVYFGPQLLTAITTATRAVIAFTVSVASNPVGLLVVALSAAIAYIAVFGNKVKVAADSMTTLQDVVIGTWNAIKLGLSGIGDFITGVWNSITTFITDQFSKIGTSFEELQQRGQSSVRGMINFIIGAFVAGYRFVTTAWDKLPTVMKGVFAEVVNIAATAVEEVVNFWNSGFQLISKGISTFAPELAANLNSAMETMKLKLPRMDASGAKDAAAQLSEAIGDAFTTDYVGKAMKTISTEIDKVTQARLKETKTDVNLRGPGKNTLKPEEDAKAAKAAERRAAAMAKINAELDNELERMFMLQPAREAQQKLDQYEEQLLGKRIKMTDKERESFKQRIDAITKAKQVQQQFDAIYEESIGPARDYNNQLEAAQKLLEQGAISQDQYQRSVIKSAMAFIEATDPLYEMNRAYEQQVKLFGMMPKQREIDSQMMELQNQLLQKGIVLLPEQNKQLREQLQVQQELNAVYQAYNQIYGETVGKKEDLEHQTQALNKALADGVINLDNYNLRLVKLGVEAANLRLQMQEGSFADVVTASLGKITEGFEGFTAGATSAMGDFFKSFTDGFADSVGKAVVTSNSLGEALRSVAQNALSSLISVLVKLGIQWAVNTALGQSMSATALATTTAMTTAAGAATAAAWAPAAAMVSLATLGGNSAPAMAGIAATNAMTQAMSLAAMVPGFREGGFTGHGPIDEVAGQVHRGEYVFDASSVNAIGLGNLMMLRNGASNMQSESSVGTGGTMAANGQMNVVIKNEYGPGLEFDTNVLSATDVEVIARRVVRKEADGIVANSLNNPNSRTSRSLRSNTNTTRRMDG